MKRRLLAALTAFALAIQVVGALAAFAEAPESCSCPRRGKSHACGCHDCSRHRSQEAGNCSIGGCSSNADALTPPTPAQPFFPALEPADAHALHTERPRPHLSAPPLEPDRDVPTPPPLAA